MEMEKQIQSVKVKYLYLSIFLNSIQLILFLFSIPEQLKQLHIEEIPDSVKEKIRVAKELAKNIKSQTPRVLQEVEDLHGSYRQMTALVRELGGRMALEDISNQLNFGDLRSMTEEADAVWKSTLLEIKELEY